MLPIKNLKSVFILITLFYACSSKNINPHSSRLHGRIISKSSSNNLVAEIIQQENEISDEKSEIEAGEGLLEIGVGHDGKKKVSEVKLPAYLKLIDDNMPIEESLTQQDGPIARAWLPVEIKREVTLDKKSKTSILFQQTQSKETLGDFIKAEMILTLKPDAEFLDSNYETVVELLVNGVEARESKTLSKKTTFYAFNITELLQRNLADNLLEHPNHIAITFQVYDQLNKNNARSPLSSPSHHYRFLDEMFDAQVERPFIMFLYRELLENTMDDSSDKNKSQDVSTTGGRKKRAAAGTGPSIYTSSAPIATQGQEGSSMTNPTSVSNNNGSQTEGAVSNTKVINSTVVSIPIVPPSPNLCRRVEWTVNADDIDWFGLVSHKKLDLGYCAGSCPFPLQNDHFNFTLHSFFVDRFRRFKLFDVPRNFPHSCCVPVKYRPIRVWEEEEENSFVHVEYQDVVVDTCGCR